MKHCFIAPVPYLDRIPTRKEYHHRALGIHLLLAHLLESEEYVEYYKLRQQEGDTIIIDNGAYEFGKPLEAEEYTQLVLQSGIVPDVVVAPDYPNQPWEKTVESYRSFKVKAQSLDWGRGVGNAPQIMAVPQSIEGDYEGWLQAYNELVTIEKCDWIGMSILGIPNAFKRLTGTADVTFNRTFVTSLLISSFGLPNLTKHTKHHYLGCSDPREILLMKVAGLAYSNDSSSAIWHGHLGIRFDNTASGLKNGKDHTPVDFFVREKKNSQIIEHNVAQILKWLYL